MSSPFPGMDPYLEDSSIRSGFHHKFATEIDAELTSLLSPEYYADTEAQIVYEPEPNSGLRIMRPDISIGHINGSGSSKNGSSKNGSSKSTGVSNGTDHHWAELSAAPLQADGTALATTMTKATQITMTMDIPTRQFSVVLKTVKDNQLVTSIELISPINKLSRADGAASYLRKRRAILNSETHLIEIDLTRSGDRKRIDENLPAATYLVLLSRSEIRPMADVWSLQLQDRLPTIPIPLLRPDPDIILDLQAILDRVYTRHGYERHIDYGQEPPSPRFSKTDQAWIDERLKMR